MQVNQFFASLWDTYTDIAPQAERIQALFKSHGEEVINDHIAFRTFAHSPVSLEKLQPIFEEMGYEAYGAFRFESKHLKARCYKHTSEVDAPKIFLSELLTEELPQECQDIIAKLVAQIPEDAASDPAVFWKKRLWDVPSLEDYLTLVEHSEYAAWLAAWGFRANHFTVSINHLNYISEVKEINSLIKKNGIKLNTSGGEIKGTKQVMLEQSATIADQIPVTFSDRTATIASCFYEFAKRYPMKNGELFQGFVEASADKIFESTNQVTNDNKIKPS